MANGPSSRLSFESYFRLSVSLGRLFLVLGDVNQWPEKGNPRILVRKESERLTVSFDDLTRASLHFRIVGTQTEVSVRHELCQSVDQVEQWKKYWNDLITDLGERLGQ